jgi:hypothetical protein
MLKPACARKHILKIIMGRFPHSSSSDAT